MNCTSVDVLIILLRTTMTLSAAVALVFVVLRIARPRSPGVHRAAWLFSLIVGCFFLRLSIPIPYTPSAQVTSAAAARSAANTEKTAPVISAAKSTKDTNPNREIDAVPSDRELPAALDRPVHIERDIASSKVEHNFPSPVAANPRSRPLSQNERGVSAVTTAAELFWNWPAIVVTAWFVGMAFLALFWGTGYIWFIQRLPKSVEENSAWQEQWTVLLAKEGIRTPIPFTITDHIGPLLCRLPRGHRLLVPVRLWRDLSPAGRERVLRHELEHYRRGDAWKSLFVQILALPHWFNPLAWLAVRQFDEAAEWACDDVARGDSTAAAAEYAESLLALNQWAGRWALYRTAIWGRGISRRVRRLVNPDFSEDSIMKKCLVLGVAMISAAVCLIRIDLVAKEPPKQEAVGNDKPATHLSAPVKPDDPPTSPRPVEPSAKETVKNTDSAPVTASNDEKPPVEKREFAADSKLTDIQRQYRDWDAKQFPGIQYPFRNATKKIIDDDEARFIKRLYDPNSRRRIEAIEVLTALDSKKAVGEILRIASDRSESENEERHLACRALGILGDKIVVPELVHLTYHFNAKTRLSAQIAMVRLTGQNFGNDLDAWRKWWQEQNGTPPISPDHVDWAPTLKIRQPELQKSIDPETQSQADREFLAQVTDPHPNRFAAPAPRRMPQPDPRAALRYDGKDFYQWRDELMNELKVERRAEAIGAMAEFGRRGYGKEATEAILQVMRDYSVKTVDNTPKGHLKSAALAAFNTDGPYIDDQNRPIDPTAAIPVLCKELKEGNENSRFFAAVALEKLRVLNKEAKAAIIEVMVTENDANVLRLECFLLSRIDDTGELAIEMLKKLAGADQKEIQQWLAAGDKHFIQPIVSIGEDGVVKFAERDEKIRKFLRESLDDKNINVRMLALDALVSYCPYDRSNEMVSKVVKMVENDDPMDTLELTVAMRVLGHYGPLAKDAVPVLIERFKKADDLFMKASIAEALAMIGPEARSALAVLSEASQKYVAPGRNAKLSDGESRFVEALALAFNYIGGYALPAAPGSPGGAAVGYPGMPGGSRMPGYGPVPVGMPMGGRPGGRGGYGQGTGVSGPPGAPTGAAPQQPTWPEGVPEPWKKDK